MNGAFYRYLVGNTAAMAGQTMLATTIGWELYERTHSALMLGFVGLVEILPVLAFALPAGDLADRLDRKKLLASAQTLACLCAAVLALVSWRVGPLWAVYAALGGLGVAQAFRGPASSAFLPNLVPPERLSRALAINTSAFQAALLLGPAAAGGLIALTHHAAPVYTLTAACFGGFALLLLGLPSHRAAHTEASRAEKGFTRLMAGLRFVWRTEILLAAITLDMVAVLLGGAVAILPVFAKDVLAVGPEGLGVLVAAPSVGALLMGFFLSRGPAVRRNGPVLLGSVAGFGLATIAFAFSRQFWMAWGALACVGATDMISMVIRSQLVQHLTPDVYRGRVAAVHSIFVGTSNQLGGFESGLTTAWWGPVRAVLVGGVGAILTTGLVAWRSPKLRSLGEIEPHAAEAVTA